MQERMAHNLAANVLGAAPLAEAAPSPKLAGPSWLVASLLNGAAAVAAWAAAEFWSLLHLLFWLPLLLAFAATLVALWCAFWMSQLAIGWARNAYFGLLLRSARRF